jgi:hypothetical protein
VDKVTYKSIDKNRVCQYAVKDNTLYLFVRGTETKQEWRWNLSQFSTVGILGGYRVNRSHYLQALDVLMHKDIFEHRQKIVILGHSRGFGIATVMALILQYTCRDVHLLGVAGKRTLGIFSKRPKMIILHPNVSVKGDIVPFLPPFYKSTTKNRWIDKLTWPWKAHIKSIPLVIKVKNNLDIYI